MKGLKGPHDITYSEFSECNTSDGVLDRVSLFVVKHFHGIEQVKMYYNHQLKGQGHNQSMSNFGLFFIFAQIC